MSSPIHFAQELDRTTIYAPGRARAKPSDLFWGDLAMKELQRQLALDPEAIPRPPKPNARVHPFAQMALWICVAASIAAAAAWSAISLPGMSLLENGSASTSVAVALVTNNDRQEDSLRDATAARLSVSQQIAEANVAPQPRQIQTIAVALQAAPLGSDSGNAFASDVGVRLGDDEIATLLKRGKAFLNDGDVASARLLLRRAAEAGSADAALALAATYDPLATQRYPAVGVQTDAAEARKWYQVAIELGSDAAAQQLPRLAQAP